MAERPQQLVATTAAIAASVGSPCVAVKAAPGTGDMLVADLTITKGIRELLLSAAFTNATTVSVKIGGNVISLLQGAAFGAGQIYGPIAIPVEEGDAVNFRLGTANDGAALLKFKVEAVSRW